MEESHPEREESREERLDRNLIELLNELRVTGTGIQVLLGFLLVVPFNTGWHHMSGFDRHLYFVGLLAIAGAAVLLLAPSVHHRLLFHRHQRPFIISLANNLAIAGVICLAIGLEAILIMVSNVVFGTTAAVTVGTVAAIAVGGLWFAVPLERRRAQRS